MARDRIGPSTAAIMKRIEEEKIDLDHLNFRNQVLFYREGLLEVLKGKPKRFVFTQNEAKRLWRQGILHGYGVSKEATEILDQFEREEHEKNE